MNVRQTLFFSLAVIEMKSSSEAPKVILTCCRTATVTGPRLYARRYILKERPRVETNDFLKLIK
jgi:hypothetical protein